MLDKILFCPIFDKYVLITVFVYVNRLNIVVGVGSMNSVGGVFAYPAILKLDSGLRSFGAI